MNFCSPVRGKPLPPALSSEHTAVISMMALPILGWPLLCPSPFRAPHGQGPPSPTLALPLPCPRQKNLHWVVRGFLYQLKAPLMSSSITSAFPYLALALLRWNQKGRGKGKTSRLPPEVGLSFQEHRTSEALV